MWGSLCVLGGSMCLGVSGCLVGVDICDAGIFWGGPAGLGLL